MPSFDPLSSKHYLNVDDDVCQLGLASTGHFSSRFRKASSDRLYSKGKVYLSDV